MEVGAFVWNHAYKAPCSVDEGRRAMTASSRAAALAVVATMTAAAVLASGCTGNTRGTGLNLIIHNEGTGYSVEVENEAGRNEPFTGSGGSVFGCEESTSPDYWLRVTLRDASGQFVAKQEWHYLECATYDLDIEIGGKMTLTKLRRD